MEKFKKNLRYFIFEEYLEIIKMAGFDARSPVLDNLKIVSNYYKNPLINLILKSFRLNYSLFSPLLIKKDKKKILFHKTTKFDSIINNASSNNAIVLGISRPNALKNLLFRRTIYYPLFKNFHENLYSGIINHDENLLYKNLDELKRVFLYLNPDFIVLLDDALPDSRAIICVSKELGIPTVEIQHGIYFSDSIINTGKYSDYLFVWGEYFKNLYVKNKIRNGKNIRILGYPHKIRNNPKFNSSNVIYYLGDDYERYDKSIINIKKETIFNLNSLCNELGFKFVYRPHPSENVKFLKSQLPNIRFAPDKEKLYESFDKGDIFISFNSTSLVEAALESKLCIQLINYPLITDNFEDLGICPSFDNFRELKTYIKEISNAKDYRIFHKKIDSKYIEIPSPDPGTRFLELLDDII
jgi:hypothetical protein